MVILVAGSPMHLVLPLDHFAAIAWLASPLMGVGFYEIVSGSPAEAAGLRPGDAIVAIDGERYQFISGETVLDGLRSRPFFFSSRRRHTRCSRDWSSDVCSSD